MSHDHAAPVHDHTGPDWRCEACKPLADVLRGRMRWASLHWGSLHDDAWPSLARAIHESDWFASIRAAARRDFIARLEALDLPKETADLIFDQLDRPEPRYWTHLGGTHAPYFTVQMSASAPGGESRIHLGRASQGGLGKIVCGLDRFGKDGSGRMYGFSCGGAPIRHLDLQACPDCLSGFLADPGPIAGGTHTQLFTEGVKA